MYAIFISFLTTVGGVVMVPVTLIILDCLSAYFLNSTDDLNNGVRTPIVGLVFKVDHQ